MKYILLSTLLAAAAVCGAILSDAISRHRDDRADSGVVGQLFGDSRAVLSRKMFSIADLYYHGGLHAEDCEHMLSDQMDDGAFEENLHDGHVAGDHSDDEHAAGGIRRDWWSTINRHRLPREHSHLAGERFEKEVLPWLWAAVKSDPNNITAYSVGAYWLSRRMDQTEKALELLREGIRKNPQNAELEFARGTLLLHDLERFPAAQEAFAEARSKWLAVEAGETARQSYDAHDAEDESKDMLLYRRILQYLARTSELEGDIEQALAYYRQALDHTDAESHRELHRRLAAKIAELQTGDDRGSE